MTTEERDTCISLCQELLSKDILAIASEVYPDEDLQQLSINEYSIPELVYLLHRALKQLLMEFKVGNWKFMSESFTSIEKTTVVYSLEKQLDYILTPLNTKSEFTEWIGELEVIIDYEMRYGFWDSSKKRVHNPRDLSLSKAQAKINTIIQSIQDTYSKLNSLEARFDSNIDKLDGFTTQKEKQFKSLEQELELVSQSLTNVRNSEKDAAISNSKITTLLEQTDKALDASRKKIGQDRKIFNELQANIDSVRQHISNDFDILSEHRINFDNLVVSAREAESHILDQEERIMTLLGFAADGTLGGVFNNRKKELQWTVGLWIGLSFASVLLALFWVMYVFEHNPSQDEKGVNWLILLANFVRTSPTFILVYFCLSQYTKERNIQEEYAFKSAVSMTVTAYADMIGTGEVNERVKMLIDTIQRIYIPPALEKPLKPVSLKSKHFAQAAKSMAETAQSLKSTVAEGLENIKSNKSS